MRLGLLDSRALFPFFHPTLPTTAGIPEYGCWQLAGAAPGGEADLCRCTVRPRVCSHFRLLARELSMRGRKGGRVDVGVV